MKPASVPEVRKNAEEYFASGLYCAESVVLSIARAEGIESELLPKAATAFCSGMARTCGTCGAVSGAMMGIGLVMGRSVPGESVEPAYEATQRFVQRFEDEFGSRNCQELLGGCDLNTPEGQAIFNAQNLGRRCQEYTGAAAEIAAGIIEANGR